MTEVTKIDGSPGAGKSYQLKQFLKEERRDHDIGLGDFSFVTFTNAAADDLVPEVADILQCPDKDAEGAVRTLHSMALSEVRRADIITNWEDQVISQKSERGKPDNLYREFCDRHALEYNAATIKDVHENGVDAGAGDSLFQINAWLSLTRRDYDKARLAPVKQPWDTETAVTLLDAWDAFKRGYMGKRRFEHSDYVDTAIDNELTPDIEVLFIDEFQDLSPQEYLYYKVMRDSEAVERVFIAGDPNQSVYSFRAGTPHYFNETPADNELYLSETRRCRGKIADFARRVLNAGPGANTDFNAYNPGGAVSRADGSNDELLSNAVENGVDGGGVFMLARTNSKVYSIKRWLKRNGYPFDTLGTRQNTMWAVDAKTEIVEALERLAAGDIEIPKKGINRVTAHSPKGEMNKDALEKPGPSNYTADSVWRAFPYADTVTDIVAELDFRPDVRKALKQAVLNDAKNDYEKIKVGTIHAAKGLESPAVLLFNSYNKHLRDSYHGDTDTRKEEHRLAYVGATRARKRLYVVDNFFDGPNMTPLDKARRSEVKA